MTPRIIKQKARDETLKHLVKTMCLADVIDLCNIYGQAIEDNGGSRDYAAECVMELLEEYLNE